MVVRSTVRVFPHPNTGTPADRSVEPHRLGVWARRMATQRERHTAAAPLNQAAASVWGLGNDER